jgi:hypothetical protein
MNRRHDDPPPSEAAIEAAANMQAALHEERLKTHDTLRGILPGPTMRQIRTHGDRLVVRAAVILAGLVAFLVFAGLIGYAAGLISQR